MSSLGDLPPPSPNPGPGAGSSGHPDPVRIPPPIPPAAPPRMPAGSSAGRPARSGRRWTGLVVAGLVLMAGLGFIGLIWLGWMMGPGERGSGADDLVERRLRTGSGPHKIAWMSVQGVIDSSRMDLSGRDIVQSIRDQLERVADDPEIRAVILSVDSPGGEVLASDEIYRFLQDFQKNTGRPVIAQMGSVAASGGYYVSVACRWIVAHELTMTGSIGVIFQGLNYRGLMDKVGVRPKVIKSGRLKDMWSGAKSADEELPEEEEILQEMVSETFERFKAVITEGRYLAEVHNEGAGRSLSGDWESLADGRILSGRRALEAGMVDELGNLETAIERALALAGIEDATLVSFEAPVSLLSFLRLLGQSPVTGAFTGRLQVDLGLSDLPRLAAGRLYFLSPLHWTP
jgi:protease-4